MFARPILYPPLCFFVDTYLPWWDRKRERLRTGGFKKMLADSQWAAPLLAGFMGILWAGSFLAYTMAFRRFGALQFTPGYLLGLATFWPFLGGLALSLFVSLLRMWVFGLVGPQRTWFLEPVINLSATILVVVVLREALKPAQWFGAGLITMGLFLLVRK